MKQFLTKAIAVRRNLISKGKGMHNITTLTNNVAYWVSTSPDCLKMAKNRQKEILIVLPPNFVKQFKEMINGS